MATVDVGARVPVDRIRVPENVRALDTAHVDALAGSIALQGVLVPLVVRARDDDGTDEFELVAGFHRLAAARQAGLVEVPVVVRDAAFEDADRAVENIARKALNPYEEARAVHAMLARGLTEDGAAQALGWSRQRVASRVKILELPERAQQLVGEGVVAVGAVDQLRAIGSVSPGLLDAVVAYLDDGNAWAGERLAREPGWVLDAALRHGTPEGVFAAHLTTVRADAVAALKLGKTTTARYEQLAALGKRLDRYAYGSPEVRFGEAEVDRARAAGVVVEFERSAPVIVDRALYRELVKTAVQRTLAELQARAADAAQSKKTRRSASAGTPSDETAEARRERDAGLRGLAEQAHGVNLDLGASLVGGLSVVDPTDVNVARFFVYALLGRDADASPYAQGGERVRQLAAMGVRLVVSEHRRDVTRTRKDGSRGRLRVDYGDARDPQAAVAWLWRFLDGAKTAGELYGRALVIIAAECYASRLVVPTGQRLAPLAWASRKDQAAKALERLAGPQLPASLKRLEQAVRRAHSAYERATRAAHTESPRPSEPNTVAPDDTPAPAPDVPAVDGDIEDDDAPEASA